jgi:small subunit ribosomal protein S6
MNKYDVLFILDNDLTDEQKTALVDKFATLIADQGGVVESTDKWGTRTYAYPINFKTQGYYVKMVFQANGEVPQEVSRIMRITDGVVRSMIRRLA